MKLTLGFIAKSDIRGSFYSCLTEFQRVYKQPLDVKSLLGKSNIFQARSMLVSQWYKESQDGDVFVFIDSDQTFTAQDIVFGIKKLLSNIDTGIVCGGYANRLGQMTLVPYNMGGFVSGEDDRIHMGATGFMFIKRETLTKIIEDVFKKDPVLKDYEGIVTSSNEKYYPFFRELIIPEFVEKRPEIIQYGEDFSFCILARCVGYTLRGFASPTLGHHIDDVKFIPPELCGGYYGLEADPKDLLVFLGNGPKFLFNSQSKGMTGSEYAIINLSQQLSKHYNVKVVGNCIDLKESNSLEWVHYTKFNAMTKYKNAIVWRGFGLQFIDSIKADNIVVDLHDLSDPELVRHAVEKHNVKKFMFKSKYHHQLYKGLVKEKYHIVSNGIQFKKGFTKDGLKLLFTSDYSRGLYLFNEVMPKLKEIFPEIELHCFYGYKHIKDNDELVKTIEDALKDKPYIIDHGRVDRDVLNKMRAKYGYHLYLTDFPEIDCLSVRESYEAGLIPISFNENVFLERPTYKLDREKDTIQQLTELLKMDFNEAYNNIKGHREVSENLFNDWKRVSEEWLKTLSP